MKQRNSFACTSLKYRISGYRNFTPPNFLLTQSDYETIKGMEDVKNIVLIKPDKGNGVVILNRDDYNNKMSTIINDRSKFKPLTTDPLKVTLDRETKLRNFLKSLKKDNTITEELYKKLCSIGSKLDILCGHKGTQSQYPSKTYSFCHSNSPLQPFQVFSFSLLPCFDQSLDMVTDTFSFIDELRNLNIDTNDIYMASYDISSLFTNVPLDETIDIIIQKLFFNSTHYSGFSHIQFRNRLCFAAKNPHFSFQRSTL